MSAFGSPVHEIVTLKTAQALSSSTTEPVVRLNILRSIQLNELGSDSEDDISLLGVSDSELELEYSEHTRVHKTNVLADDVGVAKKFPTLDSPVLNKRILNTLWKLYRNAGETIEDVITRLFNLSEGKWNWGDILSDEDRFDSSDDEFLDKSGRNVDKELIYDGLLQNLIDTEDDQMKRDCENITCTGDFLDVTMGKLPETSSLEEAKTPSSGKENENCASGGSARNRRPRESKTRSAYDVPRLKPITALSLASHKPKRARKNLKFRSARESKREKSVDVEVNNGPIVRDMYGVRTVSYDLPPPKEDKQYKRILRLSEDSHSDNNDKDENKSKPAAKSFEGEMVAHVTATGVRIVRKRPAPEARKVDQADVSQLRQYRGVNLSSDSELDGENTPSSRRPKRRKLEICEGDDIDSKDNECNQESTRASSPKSRKRFRTSSSESSSSSSTSSSSSSDQQI